MNFVNFVDVLLLCCAFFWCLMAVVAATGRPRWYEIPRTTTAIGFAVVALNLVRMVFES